MLSLMKATMPAAQRKSSKATMRTRCFRAKATIPFMSRTPCPPESRSIALGGAIDELRAAGDDRLLRIESGHQLDRAVAGAPRADRLQRQRAAIARDEDAGGVVSMDDGVLRHRRRRRVVPGDAAEARDHLGLERAVVVVDLGAHGQAVRARVAQAHGHSRALP